MHPTIRDVAKSLHISTTTVSRALDGYSDVAENTRQLIIDKAQEMGYTPNRAARQLRRQRSDSIGYIIPATTSGFADPFFAEFIAGLGDEASANNYDLLVSTAAPNSSEEKLLYQRWIQGSKVDGMVINRVCTNDWRLEYLTNQNIPHVSLERSPSQNNFIGIEVDSSGSVTELMAYLINQGHSQIAYIGANPELKIEIDRYSGYLAGLTAASIQPNLALTAHSDLTAEGGYQAACRLLDQSTTPTAIFCINDMTAIGAMHAAHERGLKVGRDIAIAGFDGIADSAHTQPQLTTIDQPVYSIARQLTNMLLRLIKTEVLTQPQIIIHPTLLIRESTGC